MKLYRRFFEYIGVTRNISAIFEIYRRNSKYISDFSNISTYRQMTTHKKETPLHTGVSFFFVPIIYAKRVFFSHMLHFIPLPRHRYSSCT
ncbi:hypothetical protein EXW49_05485 [Bacillus mycoides]|nr:hypothetical protein EXW49_05485 [Bacillus mycoides]